MGPRIAIIASLFGALGLLAAACDNGGPYRGACTDLCTVLAGECELPGYAGAAACIPSCEEEMGDADDPEDLLDCYDDAGCSVEALIECKRMSDADRL